MTALPPRISGALAVHYRLEREIGAGGMATVYLADDLRHDRRVALKVLRPELAAVIGAERFLAEIKLTANLQHPHILPLFDSGEADSYLYYVMPFVEGESLRDRLRREKQLPVDDAVRIATEVASALDYAHRHGVIHRDIKPENILLHDGRALVADFGIALAASKAGSTRMTETGMSLGTPQYMSPEQAMGEREITARSDVYALGAVLYEMLTGEPPFTGHTAQAVVARVLTETPRPMLPQRHTIPRSVEAAVLTALEKLPADRFATAAQFADSLTKPMTTRPIASTVAMPAAGGVSGIRARLRDRVTVGLAVATVAALGLAAMQLRRPAPETPVPTVRFLYTGSDSAPVAPDGGPWPAAISPDGSLIVYSVRQPGGGSLFYLRRMDQLEGHPIPGTINGSQALFSPDGRWVEFETNTGTDMKVRLDGSAPVRIAEGGANNGADWTTTDELVIGASTAAHGLSRVSVAGGDLTPFTVPDSTRGEIDHVWPIGTPDGKAVVFAIWHGALPTSELAMVSLDGGPVTRLGVKAIRPLAIVDDALVYLLADGAVMAVPLDISHRKVVGKPVPVLDPVPVVAAFNGNSSVFVSRGGALVAGLQASRSQLVWLGRDGTTHPVSRELRNFQFPRLSPDGRQLLVMVADGSRTDAWIDDLETGTLSRLTSTGNVTFAQWSRDGKSVVYSAPSGSKWGVWEQSAGGGTKPRVLLEVPSLTPTADLAPDGRSALLGTLTDQTWDVQIVRLDSNHVVQPFHATHVTDTGPRISPDGHWAAVVSEETGTFEVYVRSYPDPAVKVQVSVGGGYGAVWSADGSRLYYSTGTVVVEARIATTPGFRVLARDTAFTRVPNTFSGGSASYDITHDGSRLVIPSTPASAYPLIVVPNWRTELRERLAANRK